jgi:hypothetical protein
MPIPGKGHRGAASKSAAPLPKVIMRKLITALLFSAGALSLPSAFAHGGGEPKYGGVVQTASDLSFELVKKDDGAILYVEDHGKPLASQGMTGKLTVLTGSSKGEAELKPAGDNKLEAKGVKLVAGTKAVAALTTPAKKAVTVRFTVK